MLCDEKYIACIGSREISTEVAEALNMLGTYIVESGTVLISGNAKGSDQAFANGGNSIDPTMVMLYLPWATYEKQAIKEGNRIIDVSLIDKVPVRKARFEKLASDHHPAWNKLTQGAHRLMLRNAAIIAKADLVLAYPSKNKQGGGGTGHGIRIANTLGKSILDLSKVLNIESVKSEIAKISNLQ